MNKGKELCMMLSKAESRECFQYLGKRRYLQSQAAMHMCVCVGSLYLSHTWLGSSLYRTTISDDFSAWATSSGGGWGVSGEHNSLEHLVQKEKQGRSQKMQQFRV